MKPYCYFRLTHRRRLRAALAQLLPASLALALALATTSANADTETTGDAAAQRGYDIMAEAESRDQGWIDNSADMVMTIRRKDGREVIRESSSKSLEGIDGRDKGITLFNKPADVRGTVFLTHSYPLEPDHQWIYLPSQNRVKRISSKRQTGRFMGSEFTFEDMSAFSLEKNNYRYLGDTECGIPLQACYIVETRSKDPYSGYEKTVSYIDQQELRSWKTEYYSKRKGSLSKILEITSYQLYLDQYWRPVELTMTNQYSGAQTTMRWLNQQFRIGLAESEFRKSALERRQ